MISSKIKIIKEFVVNEEYNTIHFIVRTGYYNDSVQYWLDLIEILKKDFANVDLNNVKSIVYGGRCYKHTRGIELTLDEPIEVPKGYVERPSLEYTL